MNMQSPLEKMISMAKADSAATKLHWNSTIAAEELAPQERDGPKQSLDDIVAGVSQLTGIDKELIRGRLNRADVNQARRVAMTRSKEQGHTFKAIAFFFDERTLTTVYRAIILLKGPSRFSGQTL